MRRTQSEKHRVTNSPDYLNEVSLLSMRFKRLQAPEYKVQTSHSERPRYSTGSLTAEQTGEGKNKEKLSSLPSSYAIHRHLARLLLVKPEKRDARHVDELSHVLTGLQFFKLCDMKEARKVASSCYVKHFSPGTSVYSAGDAANEVYICIEGRFKEHKVNSKRASTKVSSYEKGDGFGWVDLLSESGTRGVTVTSDMRGSAMVLSRAMFLEIFGEKYNRIADEFEAFLNATVAAMDGNVAGHSHSRRFMRSARRREFASGQVLDADSLQSVFFMEMGCAQMVTQNGETAGWLEQGDILGLSACFERLRKGWAIHFDKPCRAFEVPMYVFLQDVSAEIQERLFLAEEFRIDYVESARLSSTETASSTPRARQGSGSLPRIGTDEADASNGRNALVRAAREGKKPYEYSVDAFPIYSPRGP